MPIDGPFAHLVIDCADPERLAEFWTAALDVEVEMRWHQYVVLAPHVPGAPGLAFQTVPEEKATKNRVHMDFMVDDLEGQTDFVLGLGATRVDEHGEDGVTARCMADPEGNEFCLVKVTPPG